MVGMRAFLFDRFGAGQPEVLEARARLYLDEVFAHPGGYYGVLRSTRVVPVIFRRQISNVTGVKYNS
jgi:hypothetical protein